MEAITASQLREAAKADDLWPYVQITPDLFGRLLDLDLEWAETGQHLVVLHRDASEPEKWAYSKPGRRRTSFFYDSKESAARAALLSLC